MNNKQISEMTSAEIEQLLEDKKREEREAQKKARQEYESQVNTTANAIITEALSVSTILAEFYKNATDKLIGMRDKLNQYGKIRSNSKGGFHLKTDDGQYKIVYRHSTICAWDERATKAEELLKDFLSTTVKKRNIQDYEFMMALLERNKKGELELSRMQTIYSKEHLYDDPRWIEAIRLFKESFQPVDTKMRLEFYKRNEVSQSWEPINLNLSSF